MRRRGHLVVFVKAPRLGGVKRRLGADVGALTAWRFYRDNTRGLLRRVGWDARWRCWLWVTPDRAAARGRWWPAHLARRPQGPGTLGKRLARALRHLPPGPVVIVGSDIPAITARHITRAFRALAQNDVALGPSPDGGYWLIGFRARPAVTFRGVRWSSPHALADTRRALPPGVRVAILETLADVDDGAALAALSQPARLARCSWSRGMSSTRLQGRRRLSSWKRRIPSQPSRHAPGEPGRAKR